MEPASKRPKLLYIYLADPSFFPSGLFEKALDERTDELTILIDVPGEFTTKTNVLYRLLFHVYKSLTKLFFQRNFSFDSVVLFRHLLGEDVFRQLEAHTVFCCQEQGQKILEEWHHSRDLHNRCPLTAELLEDEEYVDYSPDLNNLPLLPQSKLQSVAVGGTFDHLHLGHKLLLSVCCLISGRQLLCGVADGALLKNKQYASQLESFDKRSQGILSFLRKFNQNLDFNIFPITDPSGGIDQIPALDGLVLTKETINGGTAINEKRKEAGLKELTLVQVELIGSMETNDLHSQDEHSPKAKLSSTLIRQFLEDSHRRS